MRLIGVTAAALVLSAQAAHAASCGRPDLIETFPLDGATGIPVNASLSARYAQSAEYLQEDVSLQQLGVGPEPASVAFNANEGILSLTPSSPLAPNQSYEIAWPALRGLATAGLGTSKTIGFTTGSVEDSSPPHFAGLLSVDWDVERATDNCTDAAEDRFVFTLGLADASDDGGIGLLALVVFQSAGAGGNGGGSPEEVLVQRFPASGSTAQVGRSIASATGDVCFAALARDSLGQVSSGADRQVCTTTVKPPFFYGCALSGSHRSSPGLTLFALLAAGLARRKIGARRARG